MKKISGLFMLMALLLSACLSSCAKEEIETYQNPESQGTAADLGDDDKSFGDSLDSLGAYDGYFADGENDAEEDTANDLFVECISGTANAYTVKDQVLTFTAIAEESVYAISGRWSGSIVIDVGDAYKFDLELRGVSVICEDTNPITVLSGDEVTVTAKKDFENYIYDQRAEIDSEDESLHAAAIYSEVDLEIAGKGSLTVVSENNNGIHTKDDLQVKNLTLLVACADNALKGNDSVEITGGALTLIATVGDGIKTNNSNISDKGNQRGTVSITGGTHTIYAACDGIDSAYDVVIDGEDTMLSIYTDKYSNYSKEVTDVSSDEYFVRFTSNAYAYSIKYYNSDSDYEWVDASYHSTVSGGMMNYYYYSFPKRSEYSKMQFYIYDSDMETSQEETYLAASDYLTPSTTYDTFALTARGNSLSYEWTNYTTKIQDGMGMGGGPAGMGGMDSGNTDKGDHSTKGIKAANAVLITGGTVNIKSYDDAIHANQDTTLENNEEPVGDVTVNGGTITVYSNDDGLHADGTLTLSSGTVSVTNSYEGVEGAFVKISGGYLSVIASDDGINATTTTGTAISISGGTVYVYCNGDGIDSNSRTSYAGIVFSGGQTVVISTSSGNSAIDTESGYQYSGGFVIAMMPSGGMSSEATHCSNFSEIGCTESISLSERSCLTVSVGDTRLVTLQMPCRLSGRLICLGSSEVTVQTQSSTEASLDFNGVCWH